MKIVQISELPDGGQHGVVIRGPLVEAVEQIADHYQTHMEQGGWVSIAPVAGGTAIQLHAKNGHVESWRIVMRVR